MLSHAIPSSHHLIISSLAMSPSSLGMSPGSLATTDRSHHHLIIISSSSHPHLIISSSSTHHHFIIISSSCHRHLFTIISSSCHHHLIIISSPSHQHLTSKAFPGLPTGFPRFPHAHQAFAASKLTTTIFCRKTEPFTVTPTTISNRTRTTASSMNCSTPHAKLAASPDREALFAVSPHREALFVAPPDRARKVLKSWSAWCRTHREKVVVLMLSLSSATAYLGPPSK